MARGGPHLPLGASDRAAPILTTWPSRESNPLPCCLAVQKNEQKPRAIKKA